MGKGGDNPPRDQGRSTKTANGLLLLTAIIWGWGFIATQSALDAGLTALEVVAGRMFVASLGLDILFIRKLSGIGRKEIKAGIVMGICLFGGYMFQTVGLVYTTPSINAFVTSIYVILIPFIHWMLFRRRPDMFANIGAVLTIAGIGLISINDSLGISLGVGLTLVCALFYAFQLITTDYYTKQLDPVTLTVVMINFNFIIAFGCALAAAIFSNRGPEITVQGVGSILYLGFVSTFLGFLFQNMGQKYTTAVKAAIILSTESVFGAVFSAVFYKETFTARMVAGCVLIFAAVLISETKLSFLTAPKGNEKSSGNVS